jgi:threonylcarbamoyladenosine tRNA methylthiotransferase MtaB
MKRKYKREVFASRVERIKQLLPDAFIGVDVIAGTNGETEQYFLDTYNFILDQDISQLHVFPYSERPGTLALQIPHKVPVHERHERVKRLIDLSERKHSLFCENQLGKTRKVLFEADKKHNCMFGWTDNYFRVETSWNEKLVNQVVDFRLEMINKDGNAEGLILL